MEGQIVTPAVTTPKAPSDSTYKEEVVGADNESIPNRSETPTPTPKTDGDITTTEIPVVSGRPTVATATEIPEPTATETPTPGPMTIKTPIPEPTATETPTPGPMTIKTPIPEPTATETPTPGPTATETPEPTATESPTPDPNKWQMSVTKYWVDKNSIALPKEDIAVDTLPIQIWKKADESAYWEKVELVDLKAKDNWTYSWEAEDDGASWTVS